VKKGEKRGSGRHNLRSIKRTRKRKGFGFEPEISFNQIESGGRRVKSEFSRVGNGNGRIIFNRRAMATRSKPNAQICVLPDKTIEKKKEVVEKR